MRIPLHFVSIVALGVTACAGGEGNSAAGNGSAADNGNAVAAVFAGTSAANSAEAVAPASKLPVEIERWAARQASECKQGGGAYHGYAKTFRTADFNADGKPDYILSESAIDCREDGLDTAEDKWGRAGPNNAFLVSNGAGYVLDDGFLSYDEAIEIRKDPKGDRLVVGFTLIPEDCPTAARAVWTWTGKKIERVQWLDAKGKPTQCGNVAAVAKGGLPVATGKYAVNQGCADAAAGNDYLLVSSDNWSEIDGDTPIGPFRDLGGGRWSLGGGITITVTGAKSFTEGDRKMTWCAR